MIKAYLRGMIQVINNPKEFLSSVRYIGLFFILILALVLSIHRVEGLSLKQLTSDLAGVADLPPYYGLLSQISIWLWSATACICFLGWRLMPLRKQVKYKDNFFFMSFVVILLLGLDDAFMLHEEIYQYVHIPQKVVYVIYTLMFCYLLWNFRYFILVTKFVVLFMGLGCLFISVLLDVVLAPESNEYIKYLLEDGIKVLGILFLFAYYYECLIQNLNLQKINKE